MFVLAAYIRKDGELQHITGTENPFYDVDPRSPNAQKELEEMASELSGEPQTLNKGVSRPFAPIGKGTVTYTFSNTVWTITYTEPA